MAALQRDVDERVRHHAHAALGDERQQLAHVVVVHRVHRGAVRARHAALQAQAQRLGGQGLDVARERVVRLVAVHVDQLAALGRQLAQQLHAGRAVGHGALEMRNAADHVHALVERAREVVDAARRAQHAILRKGHQLQVDVGRHLALHLEQRIDREQAGVAGVHVRADRQQALGHGPVAVRERTFDERIGREQRLELAPQRDAFEQRAALVDARLAVAQRGVHVEMRVDEMRREQQALGVERLVRGCGQAGHDLGDAVVLYGNRHAGAAVGEGGVGDEEVEHRWGVFFRGALSACAARGSGIALRPARPRWSRGAACRRGPSRPWPSPRCRAAWRGR
ncbi:hypothetical protein FQZ97_519530 [compost metagenome]